MAIAVVAAGSWPLWSHLRRSPAGFPEHIKLERPDEVAAAHAVAAAREARRRSGYGSERRSAGPVPVEIQPRAPGASSAAEEQAERDRFATRWGAFRDAEAIPPEAGWSRREEP